MKTSLYLLIYSEEIKPGAYLVYVVRNIWSCVSS